MPGGGINFTETFQECAIRETLEEGGIKVTLKGVLRVEHSEANKYGSRMRVIFYAEPKDDK